MIKYILIEVYNYYKKSYFWFGVKNKFNFKMLMSIALKLLMVDISRTSGNRNFLA